MPGSRVQRTAKVAAPPIAMHIEPHALIIKLGALLIVSYPYLGLLVFARFDINRGLRQFTGIECHYPPLEKRSDDY